MSLLRKRHDVECRPKDLCPASGTCDDLLRNVARHTGRKTKLLLKPLPPGGPSGMWIGTSTKDLILVDATSSTVRQEAAVCHEVAHIVLGHTGNAALGGGVLPDLDSSYVGTLLHRCTYDDAIERAAERFGTALYAALRDARATASLDRKLR